MNLVRRLVEVSDKDEDKNGLEINPISPPGCCGKKTCPDVWELDNGDFLIVGEDITATAMEQFADKIGIADTERAVVVPRSILVNSRKNIPNK